VCLLSQPLRSFLRIRSDHVGLMNEEPCQEGCTSGVRRYQVTALVAYGIGTKAIVNGTPLRGSLQKLANRLPPRVCVA
jgi:hypothetical protein